MAVTTTLSAATPDAPSVSDWEITRSLQQAYARDSRFQNATIEVTTRQGEVTLTGRVATFYAKDGASEIARRTTGVRAVTNRLEVSASARPDDELERDVRRRLAQSSFIDARAITVRCRGGAVTLQGRVGSWAESRQAELVTGEVRGVKQVQNSLEIQQPGTDADTSQQLDDLIRKDVESSFQRDTYLHGLAIHVTAVGGVVRLEGEVPNLFHADRAVEETRLVDRVKAVESQLVVVSQLMLENLPSPPTDQELQAAVSAELKADPRVRIQDLSVQALRGTITLRGRVTSIFDRRMAERITRRVVGVVGVDSQLEIATASRTDQAIQDDVQFNLNSDSILAGQQITAKAHQGIVTLAGSVRDFASRHHAGRLVARVRGVRGIDNKLSVQGPTSYDDDTVKKLIESRLLSNSVTQPVASKIRVRVIRGAVTLTGAVQRSSQRIEAERIANLNEGVRGVVNQLEVRPL